MMRSAPSALAVVATLLLAGVVEGQNLGIPKCADACADKFLVSANCGSNVKCICSNKTFISDISCCIIPVCDNADIVSAISFADKICGAAGVTDLPQSAVCPSSASATGSTAPATTSGSAASSAAATSSYIDTAAVGSTCITDAGTTTCRVTPVPLGGTTAGSGAVSSSISATVTSGSTFGSLTGSSASSLSSVLASVSSSLAAAASTTASPSTTSANTSATSLASTSSGTAAPTTSNTAAASTAAATSTAAAATGNAASVNEVRLGAAGAAVGVVAGIMGMLL